MKKKLSYYLIFPLWHVFSLLPLRVLYCLSDMIYYPVYHIFGYRRRVVHKNLTESFPDKSPDEIGVIERKFYRYFCDYLMETVKYFSISEREIRRRMTFEGVDEVNRYLAEGKSSVLYMGHYCNWEWVSSLPLYVTKGDDTVRGHIYHRLENDTFDRLFYRMRYRFESQNIEMHDAIRYLVRCKRQDKKFVIGFISDQRPSGKILRHWTDFLGQDTPYVVGGETIGNHVDARFVYLEMEKTGRGHYRLTFLPIEPDPEDKGPDPYTREFMKMLEKTIMRAPEYWLWSHKRWKRKRIPMQ